MLHVWLLVYQLPLAHCSIIGHTHLAVASSNQSHTKLSTAWQLQVELSGQKLFQITQQKQ